jgi:hypothetical protein
MVLQILNRYRVIFPSEHGSWSMLITPFIIGAGVAGSLPATLWLCLAAAMALFLARQPIALLIRSLRGRARIDDRAVAIGWSAILLGIMALAGMGLILMGRSSILWLALPATTVLGLTLAIGAASGPRQLLAEIVGVIGLALAAPAAYISVTGLVDSTAWLVWAISALHSVISILYVRYLIDLKHARATSLQAWLVLAAHCISLAAVLSGAVIGWLPWLIGLPVSLLLLRAVYVAWRRPTIGNVKRFGFLETGFAIAFALIVIVAFASHP